MSEKEDGKLPIPMEFKHIQLPASIPVDACQGSSLEDAVRDAFDFTGNPIRIIARKKN